LGEQNQNPNEKPPKPVMSRQNWGSSDAPEVRPVILSPNKI